MLVGAGTFDDAGVYKLSDDQALVATVDYFTPVVDDPYSFGQIAVANSLSDVYAMGGRPIFGLNIAGFPRDTLSLDILGEILRGGSDKAEEAEISIIGGHTIDDQEPKYGMMALGLIRPDAIVTNIGAKPGDKLVLTKPLGSGIISTAIKRRVAQPDTIERAVRVMATLNRDASEAMTSIGVNAGTDVTGFGLLGHLKSMLANQGVGARLQAGSIPVMDEVRNLAQDGLIPGGTQRNYAHIQASVDWPADMEDWERLMYCDAQTSGGLLMAVPPDRVDAMVSELGRLGVTCAAVIGEILAGERIEVFR